MASARICFIPLIRTALHSTTVGKAPPAALYRAVRMLFPLAFALIDSEVRQINRNPYQQFPVYQQWLFNCIVGR